MQTSSGLPQPRWKKWEVPKNPLELEKEEQGMFPTKNWKNEKLKKFYQKVWKSIDDPSFRTGFWEGFFNKAAANSPDGYSDQQNKLALKTAVAFKCMQLTDGEIDGQIDEKFVEEFINWMLGKSKYNWDKETTPWGTRRLVGKDINAYLHLFVEKKIEFIKQLTIKKAFIPQNLQEAWDYFKYICCRKEPNHAYFLPAMNYWTDPTFLPGGKNENMKDPITGIPYGRRALIAGPGVRDGVVRDDAPGGGDPGGSAIVLPDDEAVFDPGACPMDNVLDTDVGDSGLPPQNPPQGQNVGTAPDASVTSGDQAPGQPIATPSQGESADLRTYIQISSEVSKLYDEELDKIEADYNARLKTQEEKMKAQKEQFEQIILEKEAEIEALGLSDDEKRERRDQLLAAKNKRIEQITRKHEQLISTYRQSKEQASQLLSDKQHLEKSVEKLNSKISKLKVKNKQHLQEKENLQKERDLLQGRLVILSDKDEFQKTVDLNTRQQLAAVFDREKQEIIRQHKEAYERLEFELNQRNISERTMVIDHFTGERSLLENEFSKMRDENLALRDAHDDLVKSLSNRNKENLDLRQHLERLEKTIEMLKEDRGIKKKDIAKRDQVIAILRKQSDQLNEDLHKKIREAAQYIARVAELEELSRLASVQLESLNANAKSMHQNEEMEMLKRNAQALYDRLNLGKYGTPSNVMGVLEALLKLNTPGAMLEPVRNYEEQMEVENRVGEQIITSLSNLFQDERDWEQFVEDDFEGELPEVKLKSDESFFEDRYNKEYLAAVNALASSPLFALSRNVKGQSAYEGDKGSVVRAALASMRKRDILTINNFTDHVLEIVNDAFDEKVPYHIPEAEDIMAPMAQFFDAMIARETTEEGKEAARKEKEIQMKNLSVMLSLEHRVQSNVGQVYNRKPPSEMRQRLKRMAQEGQKLRRKSGTPVGVRDADEVMIYETPEAQETYILEDDVEGFSATPFKLATEGGSEEEEIFVENTMSDDPGEGVTRSTNPKEALRRFREFYSKLEWTDVQINKEFIRYFKNFSIATKETGDRNKVWIQFKKDLAKETNQIIRADKQTEKRAKKAAGGKMTEEEAETKARDYKVFLPPNLPRGKITEEMDPESVYQKFLEKIGGDYKLDLIQVDFYFLQQSKDVLSPKWKDFRALIRDDLLQKIKYRLMGKE